MPVQRKPVVAKIVRKPAVAPKQSKAVVEVNEANIKKLGKDDLAVWVLSQNLLVDYRPFNFADHRYLIDIYRCDAKEIVVMKAAQMGLTIWLLLRLLHIALFKAPIKLGFYFPTSDSVNKLSKDRLAPIIKQNEELYSLVDDSVFQSTLGLKQIGESSLYLHHIGGVATKDSTPMDVLAFDEVRLIDPIEIDQTLERISHSEYKYKFFVSTAGYPGVDIHARFLRGDQRYWHSKCGCGPDPKDWVVLSEVFPDCIVDTGDEVFYQCPTCNFRINDPQNGQYVVHNPDGKYPSFHIHQMLSHYITPKEIWDHWNETTNIREFYNAKLGVPYIDEENRPINQSILDACINEAIPWSFCKKEAGQVCMGVDQRGGENHVVIAQRVSGGKKRIIHLEVIGTHNPQYKEAGKEVSPFKRLYKLMEEYDVDICVVDALPNTNEAKDFGRAFPTRVYIAYYHDSKDPFRWSDRAAGKKETKEPPGLRKVHKEAKFKWHVMLDRYTSIENALVTWSKRQVEIPDPKVLVQTAKSRKTGRYVPLNLCSEYFFPHVQAVVREKVGGRDDGIYKMKWVNLGVDPHFLHAWNYCNAALERLKNTFSFEFLGGI